MSGLAVVTGASSGIGLELARCCAADGFDLVICSNGPRIAEAAADLAGRAPSVSAIRADLGTAEGVDRLMAEIGERDIDVLVANAGIGLGGAFLDVELADALRVIEIDVIGTLVLLHRAGRRMRERGAGRILVTGSIAGFAPGSYHAVYNASKAFLNSFAYALGDELRDSGITVTLLMPGATETRFFDRAGLENTKLGSGSKADPAEVARTGYRAMMRGQRDVVPGTMNRVSAALTNAVPAPMLARIHRALARPGSR